MIAQARLGRGGPSIGDEETRYRVGDRYHVPAGTEHTARFEVDTDEIEFCFMP